MFFPILGGGGGGGAGCALPPLNPPLIYNIFNIFINDIFYFIEHGKLYNYADDNTLSYADQDYNTLINVLEKESSILIEWFNFNCMQANPDKFQAIAVGKKTYAKEPVFNIESANISCDEVVK